jgi:hypothetical protein
LRTVPDLGILAKSCENADTKSNTMRVLDMLFPAYLSHAKAYFVLDSLDECDKEEKDASVRLAQLGKASCSTAFRIYTVPHSMINVH